MAGPWEKYANPTPEEGGPWQKYGGEAASTAASAAVEPGYVEDIAKGAAGGLGRGTAGTLGMGGDIGSMVRAGAEKAGLSRETIDKAAAAARYLPMLPGPMAAAKFLTGPGSQEVEKAITPYTGEFYQPKTVPGEYASTIASFIPGAAIPGGGGLAARTANVLAPGIASETAGQVTKGTSAEPAARFMGGVLGGIGGSRLLTPTGPPTAARQEAVNVLEAAGVPVSAGVRTGSKPLQWAESVAGDMPLSSAAAGRLTERTKEAYDRAITEKLFGPGADKLPDAKAMEAGRQALSDKYNQLAQNNQLRADPQLINDIYAAERNYAANALPSQKTTGSRDIEKIRDDIANALIQGQGSTSGTWYQRQRSTLGRHEKALGNTDPEAANAMKDMKTALDQAMARSLPPDDFAAWMKNNERWRNMKRVQGAVATAGEHLSPAGVAQSVRSGRAGQYARSSDDLDELARAGATVLKELPQSGTGPRTAMQNLFNLPTLLSSGGGGALGSTFGPLGALAGAAAPSLAMRAVVSGPGQAYFSNQLAPQHMRDIMAQTLAQQAITQPNVRRRSAEQQQRDEAEAAAELRRQRLAR